MRRRRGRIWAECIKHAPLCRSLYGHSHDFMYALWWRKINCAAFIWQAAHRRRATRPTDPPTGRRALDRWELRRKQVLRGEKERKKDWLPTQQIAASSFWMAKARSLLFPRGHLSGLCFSFNIRRRRRDSRNAPVKTDTQRNLSIKNCVKFTLTCCNKLTILTETKVFGAWSS